MKQLYDVAASDFLKIWIAIDGPEHIVAWAAGHDSTIEWEDRFAHQCDVCQFMYHDPKIRKVIRDHYQEIVPDVLLKKSMRSSALGLET